MGRWKYKKGDQSLDRLEKVGRMRSRSKKSKTSQSELRDSFILPESSWPISDQGFAARVVEVHKRYCFVSREDNIGEVDTKDVWLATVARRYLTADRTQRNFVAVGDRVYCSTAEKHATDTKSDLPQCVVQHMIPRVSKISRVDPLLADREHVLAANVDQLLIVSSFLSPRVKWGLIDRYLVLAECQEITPVIVLNKLDLLKEKGDSEFASNCQERVEYYRKLGYQVFVLEARRDDAGDKAQLSKLKSLLAGKISIFSGHSGVGKSSIVNLFDAEIVQEVEPDSDIFYKGRHTTTYASFIKLGSGGYVIDTPGIRSFMIHQEGPIELGFGFVEIRKYASQCKFRECRHIDEPGCVVLAALADGDIAEWRYRNYVGILEGTTGREGRVRDIE